VQAPRPGGQHALGSRAEEFVSPQAAATRRKIEILRGTGSRPVPLRECAAAVSVFILRVRGAHRRNTPSRTRKQAFVQACADAARKLQYRLIVMGTAGHALKPYSLFRADP